MLSISESSSEDNAGLSSCLRQSTLVHVFKEPILTILTSDKIVALQKYILEVYTLSSTWLWNESSVHSHFYYMYIKRLNIWICFSLYLLISFLQGKDRLIIEVSEFFVSQIKTVCTSDSFKRYNSKFYIYKNFLHKVKFSINCLMRYASDKKIQVLPKKIFGK